MQPLRREDKHIEQWIKTEHYRLHRAERLPESDYEEPRTEAIRSILKTLEATSSAAVEQPRCMVCEFRQALARVLDYALS